MRKILTNGLLAFALTSIGFALGKHSVKPEQQAASPSSKSGRHVAVYYLHSTFRCVTCNTIEKMARELLDKRVTQNEASLRHFLRHPVLIMLTGSYANDSWTARVRELVHHYW